VTVEKKPSEDSAAFCGELLTQASRLTNRAARTRFLAEHRDRLNGLVVSRLTDLVREQAKVDTQKAALIAEMAVAVARKLGDKAAIAQSLRAKANTFYSSGRSKSALQYHEKARKIFAVLGNTQEVARTLSASIQPLILLGKYSRAFAAANQARRIFSAEGDKWRLARVELNAGNIFHRLDRHHEALACYERAYRYFLPRRERDPEAVAVALHNIAMCLVGLNDFHRALKTYEEARSFAQQRGMHLLVRQADYNIAGLYYLRGEYSHAIDILRSTRETCRKTNDHYHFALCHLDLSEIYLELNLSTEAAEMAQTASSYFGRLGMGYEAAKSLANLAIASSQQGKAMPALELFARARKAFVTEGNPVWPFLIDLYRALVLCDQGRYPEALGLCMAARQFFRRTNILSKLVLCHLLLARLYLYTAKPRSASSQCTTALDLLSKLELPVLSYQAQCLMAQIRVTTEQPEQAYEWYQEARRTLEMLRSSLHGEELKISFLKNKLEIYEGLVELCLQRDPGQQGTEEAFGYIEQGKSRTLRDLVFKSGAAFHPALNADSDLQRKVRDLRAELNWYSKVAEIEHLRAKKGSSKLLGQVKSQAFECENKLLRLIRELPSSETESAGLASPKPATLEEIRRTLTLDTILVEYFQVRDHFVVALLARDVLEIIPVAAMSRVSDLLARLEFQLGKCRMEPGYVGAFSSFLLEVAQRHLRDLYEALLGPVKDRLKGRHLVIVPHGILHGLPFQSLFDGRQYLIDSFTLSYAPSATIYSLCHTRAANTKGPALVLGVPDPAAPLILDEAKAVAASIPESELYVGDSATVDVLRKKGMHSRLIHIATHGYFRQDNPMFSGLRLGDSLLSLYDLYELKLPAELIALSGCATGLSVVAAGDELLGLARGLISAGAQSALLTLWDVHDRSTSEFMADFYRHLASSGNKALAMQRATWHLRETYPHPYYWAPFILLGKALPT
jgi:tetratricopeptide (TPR) repeat protein